MKHLSLIGLALVAVVWSGGVKPADAQVRSRIYVAPFSATRQMDAQILASLTEDFETMLIANGCYDVLERRDIDQLIKQIGGEQSLTSIRGLKTQVLDELKVERASVVAFGLLDDDVASGEYVLRGTIEGFDSRILWKDSVALPRGQLTDRRRRVSMVGELVGKICSPRTAVAPLDSASNTGRKSETAGSGSKDAPVTGSLEVRQGQLSVSPDNSRVGVSVVVTNLSNGPVRLALPYHRQDGYGPQVDVTLVDDKATRWSVSQIAGLNKLAQGYASPNANDFTVIGPSQRLTVTLNFEKVGTPDQLAAKTPGNTFSIAIGAVSLTSTGLEQISLGLAEMQLKRTLP